MDKVKGVHVCALLVLFGLLRVNVCGEFRVEELQVLDRKGAGVVVHLAICVRSIVGPAITTIVRVQLLDILL